MQCVVVWIQKEQWIVRVKGSQTTASEDRDDSHSHSVSHSISHSVSHKPTLSSIFTATLLDIATGADFVSH